MYLAFKGGLGCFAMVVLLFLIAVFLYTCS